MNAIRKHSHPITLTAVLALAALVALGGCAKKPAVESEPAPVVEQTEPAETVPADITPEPPEAAPDYSGMEPSEYGVQDVFFAFNKYDLDDAAMATLAADARILRDKGVTVLVSGHCDERGTVEYNLALGEKRAKAVRDYLVTLGLPAANVRITSYGENKPFAQGHDESAWSLNRRAHFERP